MSLHSKILLPLLLIASLAQAQLPIPRGSSAVTVQDANLHVLNNFKLPTATDTAHALKGLDSLGLLVFIRSTGQVFFRDTVVGGGHKWTQIGTGSGGTDSAIAAIYGMKITVVGTTRYLTVDTFQVASRNRLLKVLDSMVVVNNSRYLQKADSLNGYVTPKRLADSAASLRGLISSGFDSASSQGGGFHTQPYNDARYIKRVDSVGPGYLTYNRGTKLADSLAASFNTGLALKKNNNDSVGPTGYASHGRLQKVADSLAAITDTVVYRSSGATGVDIVYQSGHTITIPKIRDTTAGPIQLAGDSALLIPLASKVTNAGGSPSLQQGLFSARPSAGTAGRRYYATDTKVEYRDNGSTWDVIGSAGGTDSAHVPGYKIAISRPGGNVINIAGQDTIESVIGSLINSNNFTSLSGFTSNGGTYGTSTGKITTSGGGGLESFSGSLDFNYVTAADRWSQTWVVEAPAKATDNGFSIGIRSSNGYIPVGLAIQFDGSAGTRSGRTYIRTYRSSAMVRTDSTAALSYTAADKIAITVTLDRYILYVYVKNYTTNSLTLSMVHYYGLLSSSDILPNTGKFCFYQHGGSMNIDSVSITSRVLKYGTIFLSDSRGYGDYADNYAQTVPGMMENLLGGLSNLSKAGDRMAEIASRLQEAKDAHAKQAVVMGGINDISNGRDSSLIKADYLTIYNTLTTAGTKVWFLLPYYSGTVNQTWLKNYIVRTYPNYIDTWTPTILCVDCRTPDSVHYTANGNRIIYQAIVDANVLEGGRTRIQGAPPLQGYLQSGNMKTFPVVFSTVGNQTKAVNRLVFDNTNVRLGVFPSLAENSGTTFDPRYTLDLDAGTAYAADFKLSAAGGTLDLGTVGIFKNINGVNFNNTFTMGCDNASLANWYLGSGSLSTLHFFDRAGIDFLKLDNGASASSITMSSGAYASGSNQVGSTMTIQLPHGTGNATPGDLVFQSSDPTTSGANVQPYTSYWWMKGTGLHGIANKSTPSASAYLDLSGGTTGGFLPPILTATQMNAISTPATGLFVYNSDSLNYCVYNGTAWRTVSGSVNLSAYAPLASPTFTGTPSLPTGTTAVTQPAADNSTKLATTAYVDGAVSSGSSANQFVATADAATVTNTTAPTTIIGSGVGSLTFPANYFTVGKTITAISEGLISTDATNPNVALLFSNSNTGLGIGATPAGSLVSKGFRIEIRGVCRATGGSGVGVLSIYVTYIINGVVSQISRSDLNMNTTVSQTFNLTAGWQTASTNNSITGQMFTLKAQ